MAADKDSLDTRVPPTCPAAISQILTHAWHHDLAGLKPLLNVPGRASVQEPTTGETPLHAAIRACGPAAAGSNSDPAAVKAATAVVEELFFSGAIWNDVDSNNETPGDVAARLGQTDLYTMCVEAGVRAELLFGLLEGYEALSSEDEDEDMAEAEAEEAGGENGTAEVEIEDPDEAPELVDTEIVDENPDRAFAPPQPANGGDVNSEDYLRSNLVYSDGKLVDADKNGVMMAWETSIMRASVDALLPGLEAGRKILNIGFGMGIVDKMFHETKPARHHIIEAHPEVLAYINGPDCEFGKDWEAAGSEKGAYQVHEGRWQDVIPQLLEAGETYDAIYFDTFGEDYAQLRMFFTEYVPGLLEESGKFSFFNGLGADRQICYDVYTKVVEMHLSDAGMDVEWREMDVDMQRLGAEGEGEWEGVKRRYWTLDKYRLPVCAFMG
ncbi:uncharacterized protein JN550_003374 [Neoarthrinium moseri]|uniref:uncharacterized protein n=1 Tax=Neoarthrinium moseri TaxID=1658444 RepID=UPI001FDE9756|nr:uncharacterized protein JN550_003374 [Neoarthrinium moseri]KAI1873121.1 hypothetical protein JN550_003374 [Neoarthrinium moseri]